MNSQQTHWELGTWWRIRVSMHWTVLLAFVWLYMFFRDVLATLIASVALFALFVAHEFGHVAVLRRRKIEVYAIELNGLHGQTSHEWVSGTNDILVAWGGVGAQLIILLLATGASWALGSVSNSVVMTIAGPILSVFTWINIFLILVALLPIGPFDGQSAWAVVVRVKAAMRKRRHATTERELFPEKSLSPEKRRELEASANKIANDLMEKLAGKAKDKKDDA